MLEGHAHRDPLASLRRLAAVASGPPLLLAPRHRQHDAMSLLVTQVAIHTRLAVGSHLRSISLKMFREWQFGTCFGTPFRAVSDCALSEPTSPWMLNLLWPELASHTRLGAPGDLSRRRESGCAYCPGQGSAFWGQDLSPDSVMSSEEMLGVDK
jgi:hypothetical protein